MKIIDLIAQLHLLYNTYTDEMKSVMGEPDIMIDIFGQKYPGSVNSLDRVYQGFSTEVVITKSPCGVYDILSAFNEDQTQGAKSTQNSDNRASWPQSWEA